ncbi:hypothetical protein [Anoxynatronum buryatiense]|uniref:Uncharacterized protein n=1 Tax=Anoxynatronum buryatiense TaxID=489973 RepID=A0AA45WU67_9CLOT|nr:hypothetical protein [Anoxynatronum buryatiense]SMP44995.1 hypothetical protein SAMN06296020_102260 [Anoxynatronum buryatiense]
MTRKMGGFVLFAATSFAFLGTAVVRQENILHAVIAVALAVLAGVALKDHFGELKG